MRCAGDTNLRSMLGGLRNDRLALVADPGGMNTPPYPARRYGRHRGVFLNSRSQPLVVVNDAGELWRN